MSNYDDCDEKVRFLYGNDGKRVARIFEIPLKSETVVRILVGIELLLSVVFLGIVFAQMGVMEEAKRYNQILVQHQAAVAQAGKVEPLLKQMAIRIKQEASREPDLHDLLNKYKLKVKVEPTEPATP